MGYQVEVFDDTGRKLGYANRGRLQLRPKWYPHPSSARVAAAAYERRHPEHHCFVNAVPTKRPYYLNDARP